MGERTDTATALYLEAIRDGDHAAAIERYAGDRYTQHSTPVKDGKAGFVEFFDDFVRRNPEREIEIVRAFDDGRYVFLHVVQILNGGESRWVTADIFDTDDRGRLIEHWDVIGPWVDETVSGRSQVDGPTEPTDLDHTAANTALVTEFVDRVLIGGDVERIAEYVSVDGFAQHDPQLADGVDAYRRAISPGGPLAYRARHRVVGHGDFVAVLVALDRDGVATAAIDLFRLATGRIVERWTVMEEIPPVDQWVNSGKF